MLELRPGVRGTIAVGENEIRIQANLGIFLTMSSGNERFEIKLIRQPGGGF
ncbi:MAG: hypothetical protein V3S21_00900 [Xanthomonadales bacterium]